MSSGYGDITQRCYEGRHDCYYKDCGCDCHKPPAKAEPMDAEELAILRKHMPFDLCGDEATSLLATIDSLTARAEAAEKNVNALATQVETLTKENLELSTDLPTRSALKREAEALELAMDEIADFSAGDVSPIGRPSAIRAREALARYRKFKGEK